MESRRAYVLFKIQIQIFVLLDTKKTKPDSKRLVPAALTLSVADGLIIGSGAFENYAIALLKIDGCVAKYPVYAEDTIRVRIQVVSKRKSKSKPDRGIVTTHQTVLNQNDRVVMEYDVTRMLRCRSISSNL